MLSTPLGILAALGILVAGVIVAIFGAIVLVKALTLFGKLIAHVIRFVLNMIGDTLRAVGSIVLAVVLIPLILLNVVIGRWSASAHFGRAFSNEIKTCGLCLYRVVVGHPFRLIGLAHVTEGLENRLPQVIAEAPGADKPSKSRVGMFDGYTIVGSLPGGGSGGRLYVADPDELKRAGFERQGVKDIDQVVIKSFSLTDGSSLPQIVRESRALDAAKKLGLVLEHELTDERFFYAMPYVPGESLTAVTTRMHGASPTEGLNNHYLRSALGYATDLLRSLNDYHRGGLWHKDVKPDNIIVDGQSAHLVDFGLVTPLRSAMTLTTHGTEYFRDPELVRQALRGVKVHQIDGTKFDLYAAGAVLFSILENSFPAHGGLSQITKRCPDAVRWIVRRAMTDYDKRYESAAAMLTDLEVVLAADDPFKVRPVDLPSMSGVVVELDEAPEPMFAARAGSPVPPPIPTPEVAEARAEFEEAVAAGPASRPNLKVNHWWSGKYAVAGVVIGGSAKEKKAPKAPPEPPVVPFVQPAKKVAKKIVPPAQRAKAADQIRSARARAAAKRRAAHQRVSKYRAKASRRRGGPADMNAGLVAGLAVALVFLVLLVGGTLLLSAGTSSMTSYTNSHIVTEHPAAPTPTEALAVVQPSMPGLPDSPDFNLATLPDLVDKTILVASDLGTPMEPGTRQELVQLLNELEAAGMHIVGDGAVLIHPEIADADTQVGLMAELEAVRGQRALDSSDFASVVRNWLADQDAVDMVLWLAPAKDKAPGLAYATITKQTMVRSHIETNYAVNIARTIRETASGL